ncbi:MAG: rRNA adenine N-6-methyltransferase family protein [Pseudonocardiaceae bacterium]
MTTDTTAADPGQLRAALADYIRGRKTFRTSRVEDAFRTVPRHVFLPAVDLEAAYAPRPVVTKRADDGTAVSSASSPNLVAEMLELLDVRPGHRVLEIGAATGINAALLAELAGPTGEVVTIEVDDDLATGARAGLAAAGYHQVEVIYGDGALGHPTRAPYHRITVTAGAWTGTTVGRRDPLRWRHHRLHHRAAPQRRHQRAGHRLPRPRQQQTRHPGQRPAAPLGQGTTRPAHRHRPSRRDTS